MRRAQRALKRAQNQAEAAQRHCLISNENADVCEAITTDMMRWWTWARDLELFAVEWRDKAQKKYVGAITSDSIVGCNGGWVVLAVRRYDTIVKRYEASSRLLAGVQWQTRGTRIPSPYGECEVLNYRTRDHTLELRPLWRGGPRNMRIYMPIDSVVTKEEALVQTERIQMVAEDQLTQAVRYTDKEIQEREVVLMADEDKAMQNLRRFHRSERDELAEIEVAASQAAARALEECKEDRLQAEFLHKAELQLEDTAARMLRAYTNFVSDGKNKRPKRLGWYVQLA